MTRTRTALVALLAVFALAAAAGGFTSAGGPAISSDTGLAGGSDPPSSPGGSGGGGGGGGGFPAIGALGAAGSAGLSALFVAGFVGALLVCLVLAVALTGDDDRAPRPEDDPVDAPPDPRPGIEVTYRTPEENAVVRAWDRLTEAVEADGSETPRETARRAVDAGFSPDVVERLAGSFQAVRYGDEPPERRERDAREALAEVEGGEDA